MNDKFMSMCFSAAEMIRADAMKDGSELNPNDKSEVAAWIWENAQFPLEAYESIVEQVYTILFQAQGV